MQASLKSTARQSGASMIEVLITLVILLVGLLGVAGLILQSQRSEMESYQRVQALILLQDMVDRINANRKVADCYAVTDVATGAPYFGNSSTITPACILGTSAQFSLAIQDMTEWNDTLLGASELKAATNVGAMIGARGCVSVNTATTPATYTVSVAWQGMGSTLSPPSSTCGLNQFGSEADGMRRVVSVTFRIASLS